MNKKILATSALVLAFVVRQTGVAQPRALLLPPVESEFSGAVVAGKEKIQPSDKEKKAPEQKLTQPPATDVFTVSPAPLSDALGFTPQMLGDRFGAFARVRVNVVAFQTTTTTQTLKGSFVPPFPPPVTTTTAFSQAKTILIPNASYGAFKVAENASPMPVDRVFFTYNYFGHIRAPEQGTNLPLSNTVLTTPQTRVIPGGTVTTSSVINTVIAPAPQATANLHREVFGFEKTFLDGRASIEMRLPLQQEQTNINGFGGSDLSDLTIVGKYAFYLDRTTGNVISGGLAVTAPTGPQITTIDGDIRSTLLQPWMGYIWNSNRFFLHAFHSVVVPTDNRDVTLLFNDVGLNYWLYRASPDRLLTFVVPLVEAHVTTPVNHRSNDGPIYVPDTVIMTAGVHLGLFRNATVSLGAATPVTGPRVFNIEGFVQLNWRR